MSCRERIIALWITNGMGPKTAHFNIPSMQTLEMKGDGFRRNVQRNKSRRYMRKTLWKAMFTTNSGRTQ